LQRGCWLERINIRERSESLSNQKKAHDRAAEAHFTKKQKAVGEAEKAMRDYEADAQATRDKTARLRLLRQAKEAAESRGEPKGKPATTRKKPVKPV
jgi:hypothetical protein